MMFEDLTFYALYFVFIIAASSYVLLRNKGKWLVRIKTPAEEYTKWVKPEKDGKTFWVEPRSKKNLGWKFELGENSVIYKTRWLGLSAYKVVEVYKDAAKAVSIDFKLKDPVADSPKFDKKTSKELIEVEILKKAGKEEAGKNPSGIYILAVLIIVSIAIQLWTSGKIRFG